MSDNLKQIVALDQRLVQAAQGIKVLSRLSWPASAMQEFLSGWRQRCPKLPQIRHQIQPLNNEIVELQAIASEASGENALERFLRRSAASYLNAARMLSAVGELDFVKYSAELYGRPDDQIGSEYVSHLDAAEHFIAITDQFIQQNKATPATSTLTPEATAKLLSTEVDKFFGKHKIQIVVDGDLASKAVAGASRIRIRGYTDYTPLEVRQLLHHEAYVHTATALNGREQPHLKALGLGPPRTTKTQEGLATLSELVTMTMEANRLRRLALRTKAVHIALNGADFIEVFRLFLDSGQSETESFYSAMRVFRGGDVRGRIVFTKDIVYLQGLINVHAFVRHAIHENQLDHLTYLFAGRLDVNDIVELAPYFASGCLAPPLYLPPWMENTECLAAHFSYLNFAHELDFTSVYKKKTAPKKTTNVPPQS